MLKIVVTGAVNKRGRDMKCERSPPLNLCDIMNVMLFYWRKNSLWLAAKSFVHVKHFIYLTELFIILFISHSTQPGLAWPIQCMNHWHVYRYCTLTSNSYLSPAVYKSIHIPVLSRFLLSLRLGHCADNPTKNIHPTLSTTLQTAPRRAATNPVSDVDEKRVHDTADQM